MPFEQVVEAIQPPRSLSHSPLFQVMFALQNTAQETPALNGLTLQPLASAQTTTHFDLSLVLQEDGEALCGTLEYATDLFQPATLQRWLAHWCVLLEAMSQAECAQQPIVRLPLLSASQRHTLLETFNATTSDFPQDKCFHQLFEAHARVRPEALAIDFEGQRLSYAALNQQANQLARHLRTLGAGPDTLVAVCLERSLEMAVALLGVFKAGAAYVPIDPSYPAGRIEYMLADALGQAQTARILLTQTHLKPLLEEALQAAGQSATLLALDSDWPQIARHGQGNLRPATLGLTPQHLAYVIYTSGSTGQPKGVMLAHRGLVSLATCHLDALALGPDSRVLQFASLSFDAATWEFAMAWGSGASLHLARRERLMPGEPLLEYLHTQRITHALLAPVALAALAALPPLSADDLPVLLVGGEACSQRLVEQWAAGRRMINAYGPTEATICVSTHVCRADEVGNPPIGRPLANTRLYLLDEYGQPVPIGVRGELHVGGVGVARGYLNRPELTADRFVADPFVAAEQDGPAGCGAARMYRTGDMARWNERGELEYLGRNDQQVKLRGFRIELGEIEAALMRCAGVHEAVVRLWTPPRSQEQDRAAAPSEQRLVAYLTA